ncbi:ABC transporter ATP-binding protein [Embleya scabrispora]|uniref:ABC transporter ATP-binding protein n=1 Tax=Embleya scabrispora TaxID=159449 RepID=UPI000363C32A|nr:ABC transporter ATP-binding protein [Embleya scabrispora]MYS78691.1 ATP-binding cassette domain-containing protein [Streptomyces sp. SID5474]
MSPSPTTTKAPAKPGTLPLGTIRAEHLWKRFRADSQRMLLRDNLGRIARKISGRDQADWRWALRDIDIHIDPGEAVGLIGSNGSGKSTLLKMLTGVMYPYAGRLQVRGRVGALIEVRAGIHPDLTGRENAFLYGSLLGLKRAEVANRFDDIVDFAELGTAIDRQVKWYSSGMQMRLGFAVAAFLEPDVLLVDEVLAVGDALFQQKCLDRMRVVLEQGTTLVLVSHDLASVESICTRGIWLEQGEIRTDGPIRQALRGYRDSVEEETEARTRTDEAIRTSYVDVRGVDTAGPTTNRSMVVEAEFTGDHRGPATVHIGVTEGTASPVFTTRREVQFGRSGNRVRCTLDRLPLPRGRYALWIGVYDQDGHPLTTWHPAKQFDVAGPELDTPPRAVVLAAPVYVDHTWEG